MSRTAHRTGGLLLLFLTSTLPGVAAQSPDDAAATAADLVEAILRGNDGPPAWDALSAALAPPVEPSAAGSGPGLAEAYRTLRASVVGMVDSTPGAEALALGVIGLLMAFGLSAAVVGQMRRRASARAAAAPPARRKRRPGRASPVRRKGRATTCRDAERLEARLRASRAA